MSFQSNHVTEFHIVLVLVLKYNDDNGMLLHVQASGLEPQVPGFTGKGWRL